MYIHRCNLFQCIPTVYCLINPLLYSEDVSLCFRAWAGRSSTWRRSATPWRCWTVSTSSLQGTSTSWRVRTSTITSTNTLCILSRILVLYDSGPPQMLYLQSLRSMIQDFHKCLQSLCFIVLFRTSLNTLYPLSLCSLWFKIFNYPNLTSNAWEIDQTHKNHPFWWKSEVPFDFFF